MKIRESDIASPRAAMDWPEFERIEERTKALERLRSCQLELMAITIKPKMTPTLWKKLVQTNEGVTFAGAAFSGPLLSGVESALVTGRYDSEMRRIEILARVEMRLNDGATVYKTDRGYWRGVNNAMERLLDGESVAASEYYFIGIPQYHSSDPRYSWLERGNYFTRGYIESERLHVGQLRVVESSILTQ